MAIAAALPSSRRRAKINAGKAKTKGVRRRLKRAKEGEEEERKRGKKRVCSRLSLPHTRIGQKVVLSVELNQLKGRTRTEAWGGWTGRERVRERERGQRER